ncbi:hypothetical protein OH799_11530 [Nocardia sp. NBC_00881]|uniref:B12-binding domain-containing radical SAM protein n=1 Tax=Nocardia sp. NBC_00881 TaxID=2975995 RepID=UPI00386672E3|nr:hypothetical protein OH799_11530 [Nocardia sp. NBC_00881]
MLLAVEHATGSAPGWDSPLRSVSLTDPQALGDALRGCVGADPMVVVTGTLDRRLVLIEHHDGRTWTAADLSGQPHSTRSWPAWTRGNVLVEQPSGWLSTAGLTDEGRYRMTRPRLLLAALYHPEYFPLPRFSLAISDLARAARSTLLGDVSLLDMQLGATVPEIVERVLAGAVDVLGVSMTFGQHDLAIRLLDEVMEMVSPPLVIAGGSLAVRNERILLERYPRLLVARGAGEVTIADVLAHWHGDLAADEVRGIGYQGTARGQGTLMIGSRPRHTATVGNRAQTDMWPELDLLGPTFERQGVAQLETSRGCTSSCSFCPRGHKGQWAGAPPEALGWILGEMRAVFDQHPQVSRTLYLVDEEFIGRDADAVARALSVADTLSEAGFGWETSCRVDQAVRLDSDRGWHIERAHLWRGLVERGLRRCLFGVESGVDSVLQRFHKDTTGSQNALAIRTLTALGVPPRFTYITFDQLMNERELRETHAFQGRTDLLLRPQPQLPVEEIIDGVRDEAWVRAHATGQPFYTAISYMLVGMECLIGAAYTRKAEAAGLTGDPDPSMGRVQARYADWRIGVLASWGQLWIDRHFALDYTAKSLEKVLDRGMASYRLVRTLRRVLKHAAYQLMTALLDELEPVPVSGGDRPEFDRRCADAAREVMGRLRTEVDQTLAEVLAVLAPEHARVLRREHHRWAAVDRWRLINTADPCGT